MLIRFIRPPLLLSSLCLLACQPTVDDDDSTAPPLGCVQVAGGGVYEQIQDAIDAAPENGVITICGGLYEERLRIDKPLTLAGENRDDVQIVGDGGGTILDVDLYAMGVDAGPVTISSLSVIGPVENAGTIRGIRVSSAPSAVLSDLLIGFESTDTQFDHGSAGIELSQTHALVSDVEITSVGFTNPNGGVGILVQTDSTLEVVDSIIQGTGSYGIHADDASLIVRGTQIIATNRNELAEDGESDGSAIFVENGSDVVEIHDSTLESGSFVAAWIDSTGLLTTNTIYKQFAYGIYLPGDPGSAAGRLVDVQGCTFEDLLGQSVLSVASTSVSTSSFTNTTGPIGPETGAPRYSGINAIAPGGTISISGNTFVELGDWAIRASKGGSALDPDVAAATVSGNTIDHVQAGNGIMLLDVDTATLSSNLVYNIEHRYFEDAEGGGADAGAIVNGFGLAAFRVSSLTMSGNDIGASGFGNYVIVDAAFNSTGDISRDGTWNGFHVETSQGTMDLAEMNNHLGSAGYFSDSTVEISGMIADVTHRGPYYMDMDGWEDPLPEEMFNYYGGRAIEAFSTGTPSSISIENSSFVGHDAGAVYASDMTVDLLDNIFSENGAADEIFGSAGSVVSIYGQSDASASSHEIIGNVIDGGLASYAMEIWDSPGALLRGNTFCTGTFAGVSLGRSAGASFEENELGISEDPNVIHCAEVTWNYGLYATLDGEDGEDALVVDENILVAPTTYGIFVSGQGSITVTNNEIANGSSAGLYVSTSLPLELQIDDDGDGYPEYAQDCDDTNPNIRLYLPENPTNGIDDDCDGLADEDFALLDNDGDGYSVAAGDCDDNDSAESPASLEVQANGTDDDCDGTVDTGISDTDEDGDGFSVVGGDCDDADPSQSPGVGEASGNSSDDDCDGVIDEGGDPTDNDGDGHSLGQGDCDDGNAARYPGATEVGENGIDDDCDGWADMDAEFEGMRVTLAGNSIHDTMTAIVGIGASLLWSDDPLTPDVVSTVTNILSIQPYTWGASPLRIGGSVSLGALQSNNVAGDCVVLNGSGAVLDMEGSALTGCGGSGVSVQSGATLELGTGVIDAPGSYGVVLNGYGGVQISGGTVTGAGLGGLSVVGGNVAVDGFTVQSPLQNGLSVSGGALTVTDTEVAGSGAVGVQISGGSLLWTGGAILGSTGHGLAASAGSIALQDVQVTNNGGDGIFLSGSVGAVVDGVTLDGNQGWGLVCDGDTADPLTSTVSLPTCNATVNNNVGGDFELTGGCEIAWACTAN